MYKFKDIMVWTDVALVSLLLTLSIFMHINLVFPLFPAGIYLFKTAMEAKEHGVGSV